MIGEILTLPCRPAAGLIPRGLVGSSSASGTTWSVCRGDLIQAHRNHLGAAQQLRGCSRLAAQYLGAAAECRRLLAAPHWFTIYTPAGRRVQGLYRRSEAHTVIQVLESSSNYAGWTLHTAEEH